MNFKVSVRNTETDMILQDKTFPIAQLVSAETKDLLGENVGHSMVNTAFELLKSPGDSLELRLEGKNRVYRITVVEE